MELSVPWKSELVRELGDGPGLGIGGSRRQGVIRGKASRIWVLVAFEGCLSRGDDAVLAGFIVRPLTLRE